MKKLFWYGNYGKFTDKPGFTSMKVSPSEDMGHYCDRLLHFSLLQAGLNRYRILAGFTGTSLVFITVLSDCFALAQTLQKVQKPVVDVNTPRCYLQTTDGKVLDLERLCKASQPASVVISSLNYRANFLIGRVVNQSRKPVHGIEITYQVLNEDGTLDQQSISSEPQTLTPEQFGAFEVVVPAGGKVQNIAVTWRK